VVRVSCSKFKGYCCVSVWLLGVFYCMGVASTFDTTGTGNDTTTQQKMVARQATSAREGNRSGRLVYSNGNGFYNKPCGEDISLVR
jgi:hypothetical protein